MEDNPKVIEAPNTELISVRGYVSLAPLNEEDWPTRTLHEALKEGINATVFGTLFELEVQETDKASFAINSNDPLPRIFRCRGLRVESFKVEVLTSAEIELGKNLLTGGYDCESAMFGTDTLITVEGPDMDHCLEVAYKIAAGDIVLY